MEQISTVFLYDDGFVRLLNRPAPHLPSHEYYYKGYRVRVMYEHINEEAIAIRRRIIAKILLDVVHRNR